MWVTRPLARGFVPERINDPERSGAVDWALFNANFERFLNTPWWRVNEGHRGPAWLRAPASRYRVCAAAAGRDP